MHPVGLPVPKEYPLIEVDLSAAELAIEPGGRAQLTVTLHNRQPHDDHLFLEIEGIDVEWYALPVPAFNVPAGGTQTAQILFKIARSSESRADTYPFLVRARGMESGESGVHQGTLVKTFKAGDLGFILHSRHQYHWHTGYVPPQPVAAPHLGAVVARTLGPRHPDVNVEIISGAGDELTMRVWERGVGETESCGTGACAAVAAAHEWGIAGTKVTVHQPGGDLEVRLGDTVTLTGPAEYVCTVDVP